MSTINDGGPAFPHDAIHQNPGGHAEAHDGMSLRDYFAAAALQGTLGNPDGPAWAMHEERQQLAERAYQIADAMLAAREKRDDRM